MGKALDKFAFAVTKAGHKFDKEENQANSERVSRNLKNEKKYADEHPVMGFMSGNHPMSRFNKEVSRNKFASNAAKHSKGENSYNPFSGLTDKSYKESKKTLGMKDKD